MDADERACRVALVASELLNPDADSVDALAVLERERWGVIQLPAADYPDEVAGPLLEQVAEQAEEFVRNGYALALVGSRDGLTAALERCNVPAPRQIEPASADELRAFLTEIAPHDWRGPDASRSAPASSHRRDRRRASARPRRHGRRGRTHAGSCPGSQNPRTVTNPARH